MSYFPIGSDNEKMTEEEKRNISMNDTKKKTTNYARHVTPHSKKTRKLISQKQQERYETIRELIRRGQDPVTEQRIKEIVAETIKKYINNDQNNS